MTAPDPTPSHAHTHGSTLSVLTKKVGPMPGWAWVVLMVGGYLAYRHFYKGSTFGTSLSGAATTAPTADPNANNSGSTGLVETTLPGPGNGVTTNREWARQAELLLQPQHRWTPGVISTALSRYLSKKPLTVQEIAVVNAAIAIEGPPPQGVLPIIHGPTPKPPPHHPGHKPPPKHPKHPHMYRVPVTMTWQEVAQHFYGNAPGSVGKLEAANPHVHSPIKPGTTVILPN